MTWVDAMVKAYKWECQQTTSPAGSALDLITISPGGKVT